MEERPYFSFVLVIQFLFSQWQSTLVHTNEVGFDEQGLLLELQLLLGETFASKTDGEVDTIVAGASKPCRP